VDMSEASVGGRHQLRLVGSSTSEEGALLRRPCTALQSAACW
jgi:hypothetical protein